MIELLSRNEPETLAVGRAIGALLAPGDVIAIDGPLGAGKTRLVRGIALGLGLPGSVVSSPTYVMVNEYTLPDGPGIEISPPTPPTPPPPPSSSLRPRRLFHVDAYRLTGPDDLDSLGWDRVVDPDANAAVAIEWAERILAHGTEKESTVALLEPARTDPTHAGAEPAFCRVRMEPVHLAAEPTAISTETDEPAPGLRRITIELPKRWADRARRDGIGDGRIREAWQDWQRLTRVLAPGSDGREGMGASRAALPGGWARCPSTGRPVPPDAPTFPFADRRARMADLGRWMTGAYTISREVRPEDEAETDFGHPTA